MDAAGGPGDAAVALADGYTAGVLRGAMAPTGHDLTSELRRVLKQLKGRAIHRPDRP